MRLLFYIVVATLISIGVISVILGGVYLTKKLVDLISKLADFMGGSLGIEDDMWFFIIAVTCVLMPFIFIIIY